MLSMLVDITCLPGDHPIWMDIKNVSFSIDISMKNGAYK